MSESNFDGEKVNEQTIKEYSLWKKYFKIIYGREKQCTAILKLGKFNFISIQYYKGNKKFGWQQTVAKISTLKHLLSRVD